MNASSPTLLLDYGDRVQKSVYEAELDDADLQKILQRADAYIGEFDSLRVYPLCKACLGNTVTRGREAPEEAQHQIS